MKTRIHRAGGAYGNASEAVWAGSLPMISGLPGMRIVVMNEKTGEPMVFSFKQVCLEIHGNGDESNVEQVIYVADMKVPDDPGVILG